MEALTATRASAGSAPAASLKHSLTAVLSPAT